MKLYALPLVMGIGTNLVFYALGAHGWDLIWPGTLMAVAMAAIVYVYRPRPYHRDLWDHGTGEEAIVWALTNVEDPVDFRQFVYDWQHGDLMEWPDYYKWLDSTRQPQAA